MIQNKIHTKDRPMKVHGQNNEITFLDENGKKIKKIKGLELTIIGNCNKVIINTRRISPTLASGLKETAELSFLKAPKIISKTPW